jgi:DNA-binding transcriptional LysR family regulator
MTAPIDHRLLRVLCAVVETRSVSHAADRLGITQPTASYLLGRLRELLRDPLFIKSSGGMTPTPKSLALYREIRRGLDILDAAFDPATFDPAHSERTFRLAMIDIGELVFLPPILRRLQQVAPRVAVQSVPMPLERIARALDLGEIDFGIGVLPAALATTANHIAFRDQYVAVMRRGHPAAGVRLTRRTFEALSHVAIASPYSGSITVEHALAEAGITRRPQVTVANYTSVPDLISQTDLVAVAPSRVARSFTNSHGLRPRPLPFQLPPFSVRVHWSARHESNAAHTWMRELLVTSVSRL